MRRITILALLALAGGLIAAGVAQARLPQSARELRAARLEHRALPPQTQLRLANRTIHAGVTTLVFLRRHPHAGTYRGRQVIAHNHAWLVRFGMRHRHRALERLREIAAARAAAALPAHYRGWLCIHLGASFNNTGAHEGTSTSGTYTGPLQMTNPWLGYSGSWGYMNELDVYQIAERGAAAHGFAYSFMAGQWPNTFPPCAGYF